MVTRRTLATVAASAALVLGLAGASPAAAARAKPAIAPVPHNGYILLGADGGIFDWNLPFNGAPAGSPGSCASTIGIRQSPVAGGSCLSIALTPTGDGYWILNALTGLVYPNGDAGLLNDPNDRDPAHRMANVSPEFLPQFRQIVATPSGHGYWVYEVGLSDLGRVDAYGDAVSYGDTATRLAQVHDQGAYRGTPVAMAATPDGRGYWEVYSDGGVFSFGDAHFYGSMGGHALIAPIVGITATASGRGYWLVASDGGVFAFGDATFEGSMGRAPINEAIVGMARAPGGTGYWLTSSDGGIFAFGGAPFFGAARTFRPTSPIVAIASRPVGLT